MMRLIYIIIGILSLIIGMIGVILPILPTTPFIILAVYLFAKGSTRFHHWFTSSKIYQKYLKSFVEKKIMTRKQKWTLMIVVDVMLIIPFIMIDIWFIRAFIILLNVTKYYYFTKVYTIESR